MRATLLQTLSRLSLEVALSAAVLSFILANFLTVLVHPLYYSILSLAVISIYSLDHAFDIRTHPSSPLLSTQPTSEQAPRHTHKQPSSFRYYLLTAISAIILTGLLVTLAWIWLPQTRLILELGALLSLIIGSYFYLAFRHEAYFYVLKELSVACLFTLGLAIPPIATHLLTHYPTLQLTTIPNWLTANSLTSYIPFCLILFAILAHNALMFSYANSEKDSQARRHSIILKLGNERSARLIHAWGFLTLLGALIFLQNHPNFYKYYLITAIVIQGILFKNINRLQHHNLFSLMGNGYFVVLFIIFYFIKKALAG